VRRGRQGERHCRPTCSGGGNPLIEAVGKAGIEVRLERHGTRLDVPRAILLLRVQQKFDRALISGIGYGKIRGLQGKQRSSRRVGATLHEVQIGPTPIGPLLGEQLLHGFLGRIPILAGPGQPEQPSAPIFIVRRLRFRYRAMSRSLPI
jgi:hypothetical protein